MQCSDINVLYHEEDMVRNYLAGHCHYLQCKHCVKEVCSGLGDPRENMMKPLERAPIIL